MLVAGSAQEPPIRIKGEHQGGTLSENRILLNRYRLLELVGAGATATVWKATDEVLARHVAVKVFARHSMLGSDVQGRFEREARMAASVSHENIVTVHDCGADQGDPFLVMEFVEGVSLRQLILSTGRLSFAATTNIVSQVLSALTVAHNSGIIHRDIKPENILVRPDGVVKVADFGIALSPHEARLTTAGTLIGTPSYLAPEQLSGGQATASSDLYSVGCVVFECLVGSAPFAGEHPVAVAVQHQQAPVPSLKNFRPDVPEAIERVVVRALQKDPNARFFNAQEMHNALGRSSKASTIDLILTARLPAHELATTPLHRDPTGGLSLDPAPRRSKRWSKWVSIGLTVGAAIAGLAWYVQPD